MRPETLRSSQIKMNAERPKTLNKQDGVNQRRQRKSNRGAQCANTGNVQPG